MLRHTVILECVPQFLFLFLFFHKQTNRNKLTNLQKWVPFHKIVNTKWVIFEAAKPFVVAFGPNLQKIEKKNCNAASEVENLMHTPSK